MKRKYLNLCVFILAICIFSNAANACPVCFAAEEEARKAFLGSTAFLTLLPLLMIFSVVYFLRRKFIKHEEKLSDNTESSTREKSVLPFTNN